MTYQTPELLLVGAAQGIVLGSLSALQVKDNDTACGPFSSRDTIPC